MFDSLIKSKFYTRCKSLIKMTRTRLEVLKNKKKAVAKYFKNDIASLLKTGLDYNAYGRAEGLLVELDVIARYDFIEQFCRCISSNLSAMDKQKECPEECKEAVQSLIYAAARFAEFPELRDLRYRFAQRYGTSFEMFINKEFVEKLKPNPVTKDMKLQLMHDIAQEFSIQWSSKSLEHKLFQPQPAKQHSFPERESLAGDNSIYDKYKRRKSMNETSWIRKTKSQPPVPHGGAMFSEEQVTPTGATKGRARAFSMQPDTLNGHVHPNLPDWDELAVRIAALTTLHGRYESCAACMADGRECRSDCIFASVFSAGQTHKFTLVNRFFLTRHIEQILQATPPQDRRAVVDTLTIEARCRMQNPASGVQEFVFWLQQ